MIEILETKKEIYLSRFGQLEEKHQRHARPWLRDIRRAAIQRFGELGFPTTRDEEWKYTSVSPIAKIPFAPATNGAKRLSTAALDRLSFKGLTCSRLVFVNGRYSEKLSSLRSLPQGVRVRSLAATLQSDPDVAESYLARHAGFQNHAFTALNTAFLEDGAFVLVPRGVVVEEPIHLLFISTGSQVPSVSHPRNLYVVEEQSQVTVVEDFVGLDHGVYFTNAVTEIVQGKGAVIDFCKLQRESEAAYHVAGVQIHQDRGSIFTSHSISMGGGLVRNDIGAILDAEGAECTLNGLYVLNGRQHEDNHTCIEHAKPHCSSHELYKGILDGRSTGVFSGKILVRKDAQKTDARQTNKNLVLSDDAAINTKPQLEIFADDVKCTHGATIGQLDDEALFYLRTRGIGEQAARNMLTCAFARDIIHRIGLEPLRAALELDLQKRFEKGSA